MAFNHTLSALLRGGWLIDKQWANSQLPLLVMMLQGTPVSFVNRTGNEKLEKPFALDPSTMDRHELVVFDYHKYDWVPNPNIPKGSVGILPINGPVTKYNGECGEPGSIQKTSWLNDFIRNDKISSIVQILDTPGGEARAANGYVSTIKKSGKPVLSYVDGMCASLGVWYSSASSEVYLSSDTDSMGSIGTYCSLVDFSGYLEKAGIRMIDVYAPQSTDKNRDYKDAIAGDTSAIEKDLEVLAANFISHVKNSLGDKAKSTERQWSTGKMFYASEAVSLGLAHGIKSFDQVVSKAAWLSKRKNS